jgi:hypothetical protein
MSTVAKAARVSGSTTRNIAEMHRMVIEELRTNLAAMRVSSRAVAVVLAVAAEPVAQVASVALVVQVGRAVLEALAVLAVQVGRAVLEALAALAVQVARAVLEALAVLVSQAAREALVALAGLVSQVAPVALAGLVVRAARERRLVKAAPELVIVQVVELETAPVVAPVKAKLVIAAHHRGLVRVRKRAADMAVVAAATTRAPAATEVGRAWAAAE